MRKINNYKTWIACITIVMIISSCKKDDNIGEVKNINEGFVYGQGVFIINEGTFMQGNGSIYFYNNDLDKLYEDVFLDINERPLGDIPSNMEINGNKIFLVVNNSGKIEVVNPHYFFSMGTIEGFSSPREIEVLNYQKAYVSDLSEPFIYIVNTTDLSITGTINTQKSVENIIKYNDLVYVTNWSNFYVPAENNTVQVIDITNDQLINEIELTKEPNSMVLDKNNILWVLCSGGFLNEEIPALYKIDPTAQTVIDFIQFPDTNLNPNHLCINGLKDTLYFLNNGVYKMSINDILIPSEAFIDQTDKWFYSLFIDPDRSWIFVSDAKDFIQDGVIYIYRKDGTFIKDLGAGIVPGSFCFSP